MMKHTDILPSRKSSWKNDAWKTSDVFLGIRPIFMGKPACSSREDKKFLQPPQKKRNFGHLAESNLWHCIRSERGRAQHEAVPGVRVEGVHNLDSPLEQPCTAARPKRSFLSSLFFELLVQLFCDHPRSCCPSRAWWADLNTWPKNSFFWDWSKPDGNLRIPPMPTPKKCDLMTKKALPDMGGIGGVPFDLWKSEKRKSWWKGWKAKKKIALNLELRENTQNSKPFLQQPTCVTWIAGGLLTAVKQNVLEENLKK